jgi:hypothetical protein
MSLTDLDVRLCELLAAVRVAYARSPEADALVRAAIAELGTLGTAEVPPGDASLPRLPFHAIVTSIAPRASSIHVRVAAAPRPVAPSVAATTEARITEILAEPARPGETIEAGFRRKELELGELFATLAPLEARALHRRLAGPAAAEDPLATRFMRLVTERRARLLAFLGDARRRAALRVRTRGAG